MLFVFFSRFLRLKLTKIANIKQNKFDMCIIKAKFDAELKSVEKKV
jgi:hypothetical protein